MPASGAMRVWGAGQALLAMDAGLSAIAGLVGDVPVTAGLGPRALVLVAALALFFVPSEIAFRVPAARARWWFWVAGSLPAAAWIPVLPFVFLAIGPRLGSPTGLALVAIALVGAVAVVSAMLVAVIETRRGRPEPWSEPERWGEPEAREEP